MTLTPGTLGDLLGCWGKARWGLPPPLRFALKSLHVNQEIFSSGKGEGCCASQDDFIEADGLWGRAMRI